MPRGHDQPILRLKPVELGQDACIVDRVVPLTCSDPGADCVAAAFRDESAAQLPPLFGRDVAGSHDQQECKLLTTKWRLKRKGPAELRHRDPADLLHHPAPPQVGPTIEYMGPRNNRSSKFLSEYHARSEAVVLTLKSRILGSVSQRHSFYGGILRGPVYDIHQSASSQRVGRTANAPAAPVQHMGVNHGGSHVLMSKQFLHGANVVPRLE